MELCRREDACIEAITHVVQTDPALAARLLRLANAVAFRTSRPVAAVPHAVMRLGMTAVRQAAMGFSMVDQYRRGQCEGFDYDRFWSHSLLMVVAMQALAARSRIGSPRESFTCGLMARIGCLALATLDQSGRIRCAAPGNARMSAIWRRWNACACAPTTANSPPPSSRIAVCRTS